MMCTYQRGTWECRGDGFLWDADCDGYDPTEFDHPCPECNTKEFLAAAKEYAETTTSASCGGGAGYSQWTGADWWRAHVEAARKLNPDAARKAEHELCPINAMVPADNADGYAIEVIAAAQEPPR